METVQFECVSTDEQKKEVAALAEEIWNQHFTPLIGSAQVAYMLDKFQSYPAITKQIAQEGYRYFLIELDQTTVGYFAVRPEKETLFLSKIYIKQEFRGRGYSRRAVDFMAGLCKEQDLRSIYLTVNRGNAGSIAAYEAMGFRTVRCQKAEIGGGFVMDDYVMEKLVV